MLPMTFSQEELFLATIWDQCADELFCSGAAGISRVARPIESVSN